MPAALTDLRVPGKYLSISLAGQRLILLLAYHTLVRFHNIHINTSILCTVKGVRPLVLGLACEIVDHQLEDLHSHHRHVSLLWRLSSYTTSGSKWLFW